MSVLLEASKLNMSATCANCREPPLMTADNPALVTVILAVAVVDCPLTTETATRVTLYSVATVRAYAGSLNTVGLCEVERRPLTGDALDSPGALAATVQL
jgi:hypothetical protein